MKMSFLTAELSKDPSTKVGSVVVSADYRKFSIGYNGFATGFPETEELWNKRELKHELVVHAELNAIINCPFDTKDCILYCTHMPCHRCLPHIINAGIVKIYYHTSYCKLGHEDLVSNYFTMFQEVEQISLT